MFKVKIEDNIKESLCQRCGDSLEESFIAEKSNRGHYFNEREAELTKTIQEQLDYIIKVERECRDLRSRNSDITTKNELILNELEIIKVEFTNLTSSYNRSNMFNKDNSTQTEEEKKSTSKSESNTYSGSQSSKQNSTLKSAGKKFVKKPSKEQIINININNNNKTSSMDMDRVLADRETLQNLRFDNSVLAQELVGLNRDLTKLKNENKQLTESYKKIEKEKTDLSTKLKSKSEGLDKMKKENEDLMVLIQTSNYKTIIGVEVIYR